jgi:spermidine synthase
LLVYLSMSRILIPFAVIFPVTFMLGFLFPIVTHSYVQKTDSIGSGMGMLYSMNTLGCILGSLVCGYIMISFLGTRGTIILLSLINGIMGMVVLLEATKNSSGITTRATAGVLLGGAIVAGIFSPDPFYYVIKKMVYADPARNMEIYYHKEGVAATTTAFGSKSNPMDKHIFINGIGMTELVPETKFIAHLPILLHPDPHNMLIICFGMGTCLRAASTHDSLNCDVVELIGEEFETYHFFHANGDSILAMPRIHHYVDDGRNFLLMRDKKYDIISIDPAPPIYSAGTVNLYTSEFFNLCKSRLTPKGVMCLWIPTSSYPEVRMIMKTFLTVFPEVNVYGGIKDPGEIMIGRLSKQPIDTARFIAAEKDAAVMHDMNEWSLMFKSPVDMLNLLILDRQQLEKIVAKDKVISDNHPYTEFPMWRLKFDPEERVVLNAPLLRKVKSELAP